VKPRPEAHAEAGGPLQQSLAHGPLDHASRTTGILGEAAIDVLLGQGTRNVAASGSLPHAPERMSGHGRAEIHQAPEVDDKSQGQKKPPTLAMHDVRAVRVLNSPVAETRPANPSFESD